MKITHIESAEKNIQELRKKVLIASPSDEQVVRTEKEKILANLLEIEESLSVIKKGNTSNPVKIKAWLENTLNNAQIREPDVKLSVKETKIVIGIDGSYFGLNTAFDPDYGAENEIDSDKLIDLFEGDYMSGGICPNLMLDINAISENIKLIGVNTENRIVGNYEEGFAFEFTYKKKLMEEADCNEILTDVFTIFIKYLEHLKLELLKY